MVKVYSIIIRKTEDGYLVQIPDLGIETQGNDIADSIAMARDAIGLWAINEEDCGRLIPEPTNNMYELIIGDIVTLVDVDFTEYRLMNEMKATRVNCSIPTWQKNRAEKNGANFSKILQDSLKELYGEYR